MQKRFKDWESDMLGRQFSLCVGLTLEVAAGIDWSAGNKYACVAVRATATCTLTAAMTWKRTPPSACWK